MSQTITSDYSLTGVNATLAVEKGLAEAEWYTTPVPKADIVAQLRSFLPITSTTSSGQSKPGCISSAQESIRTWSCCFPAKPGAAPAP